jgi:hypothetical protein
MRVFSGTSGCGKGGDTGPPFRSLASASSMRSWMSGVETTLHGSMDWSRRLLLFPGSSMVSSLKLDLQFFLQKENNVSKDENLWLLTWQTFFLAFLFVF